MANPESNDTPQNAGMVLVPKESLRALMDILIRRLAVDAGPITELNTDRWPSPWVILQSGGAKTANDPPPKIQPSDKYNGLTADGHSVSMQFFLNGSHITIGLGGITEFTTLDYGVSGRTSVRVMTGAKGYQMDVSTQEAESAERDWRKFKGEPELGDQKYNVGAVRNFVPDNLGAVEITQDTFNADFNLLCKNYDGLGKICAPRLLVSLRGINPAYNDWDACRVMNALCVMFGRDF